MNEGRDEKIRLAAIVLLGLAGAATLWYWGAPSSRVFRKPTPQELGIETSQTIGKEELEARGRQAFLYGKAIKEGQCDEVVAMTRWMRERLDYAAMTSGDPSAREKAKKELCEKLQSRPPEGNQLGPQGIDDKYVFSPGAKIEIVALDEGRTGLASAVKTRAWLRVTYPHKRNALRDRVGNAVRSLLVGVNISEDGYVLKAGIQGNLDIEMQSLSYNWSTEGV